MDILATTQEGQAALDRAQSRMEQYHRIVNESVKPETVADAPAPPPPVWPEDDVQDDKDSDDDVPARLGNMEASIDAIHESTSRQNLMEPSPKKGFAKCSRH